CSQALAGFRALTIMLSPVLPTLAERVARELFSEKAPYNWSDAQVLPQHIAPFKHLMQRVDPKLLDALLDAPDTQSQAELPGGEAIAPTIGIEDFAKIDLRVARITACEAI